MNSLYFKIIFFLWILTYPQIIFSQHKNDSVTQYLFEAKTSLHYGSFIELKSAIDKLDTLRNTFPNNKLYRAYFYTWKGSYCSEIGDYKESLDNEFTALKIFKELENNEGICFAYKEIGATYRYFSGAENLISAKSYLIEAKNILPLLRLTDTNLSINLANRVYTNLANTYLGLINSKALKYCERNSEHKDSIQICCNDSVSKYLILAESTNKEIDKYGIARVLFIKSKNYVRNDINLATKTYKNCIKYSLSNHIPITYIDASNAYAELQFKNHQLNEALLFALKAYNSAMSNNKKKQIAESSSLLSRIYDARKNTDSSYYYLKQKDLYRDSLLSEQKIAQWGNFEADKKVKEEDEKRAIEQHNTEISFLSIGGIILIIFRIYVYFLRVRAKRKAILPKWLTSILDYVGVINLLLIFECFNLAIHHRVAELVHHNAVLMLIITTVIAFGITIIEHKIKHTIRGLITALSDQNNSIQNIITKASHATKQIISKRMIHAKKSINRKYKKHR